MFVAWSTQELAENSYWFRMMNGTCLITADAIYFVYDDGWRWLERVFGKPSHRRDFILATILEIPLLFFAAACFALDFWQYAVPPLIFGLILFICLIAELFTENYVYPDCISRNDIQEITSCPPTRMRLGVFTIAFRSNGNICKTAFCLPAGSIREQSRAFGIVSAELVAMGLIKSSSMGAE